MNNQYDGVLKFAPEELKAYKGYIVKLSGMISDKKDSVTLVNVAWHFLDNDQRKLALFACVLGAQKIDFIITKVAPQLPDMAHHFAILQSVEGKVFIEGALDALRAQLKKSGFILKTSELGVMRGELEYKIGLKIPDN
jgi:hypothetical protein